MNKTIKKFDSWIATLLVVLALAILVLVLIGDRSFPKVAEINLKTIINPAEQKFVELTFNRLMDRKSVEDAFKIEPSITGKFSWAGRSLLFTPDKSFQYGEKYKLTIAETAHSQDGKNLEKKYQMNFGAQSLKIAYLGLEGADKNKIIFADLSGKKEKTLTDGSFLIQKFIPAPDGKSIYILASKKDSSDKNPEIYLIDVATDKIRQLTSDKKYLNKNIVLSDEGTKLIVNRIELSDSEEFVSRIQLWLADTKDLIAGKKDSLKIYQDGQAQGLDTGFSPKGLYLLYRNADSNYELTKADDQNEKLFIGEFSNSFGFHPFLPKIAFTEYDQEDVFSLNNKLVLFSGDGDKKDLPFEGGIVRDAQFTKDGKSLIVLFSGKSDDLTSENDLTSKRLFHLYIVNLADNSVKQITEDTDYSELLPQVSNDSRYILFERQFADAELVDPGFIGVGQEVGDIESMSDLWIYDNNEGNARSLKIQGTNAIFLP